MESTTLLAVCLGLLILIGGLLIAVLVRLFSAPEAERLLQTAGQENAYFAQTHE